MKNRFLGISAAFATAALAVFGYSKPALADVLWCYEGQSARGGNQGVIAYASLIKKADEQAWLLKNPMDQVESNFITPNGTFHLKTVLEESRSIFGWAKERKILVVITQKHPSLPKEAPKTFHFITASQ